MRVRTLAFTAAAGIALLAATMFQASALCRTAAAPVATVSAAAPAARVAAEGRVVAYPGAEIHVAAERGGRLLRVLVEEGRTVREGELMAEIDSDELRASLDEVRARVAEADAEIRLAEINQRRRQELVAQKVVAAHDLDEATRDLDIARARRETARAETTRLEAQLRKTRIVAPISGTVVARVIDPGETVEAGDHLLTVADLSRLRIEGEADEADAASLAHGAPVDITAAGYPGRRWQGAIEDVAEAVSVRRVKPQDPGRPTDTRVLVVKVAFAEPSPLKLGTTVELAITGPSAR